MDDAKIELRFDNARYGYWQRVEIRESVDDLCASVRLGITVPGSEGTLGLTANTVADVLVGDTPVARVRPDSVRRQVDPNNHGVEIEARSLGRELVDCQYSKTLSGLKLGEIVKRLCRAFDVPLKIDSTTAVVPDFSMECEPPANAVINAVRAANLLLYPTPDGGLILTEPSDAAPVATLKYGEHIKRYTVIDEYKLRFGEYVVKGYDWLNDSAYKGVATDAGISFFRPMYLVANKTGSGLGGCSRRAKLELARRTARAHRIELEVSGWRYLDGVGGWKSWAINTQARIVIPDEGINDVFLIGERTLILDDKGGRVTRMQVMPRDAFTGAKTKAVKQHIQLRDEL